MLRVGLTGGLGSGKTTVAKMFAALGADVIEADAVGREMMQPGHAVYDRIVEQFGSNVVREDGSLNRRSLAELAFSGGRLQELNRIVHPPVIAAQEEWMQRVFANDPNAIAMVESALIFEASGGFAEGQPGSVPGWRDRFDRIVLVTAPDEVKIQRFVARALPPESTDATRAALRAEAQRRLAAQIYDEKKAPLCDWIIENSTSLDRTRQKVEAIYAELQVAAQASRNR